MSQVVIYNLGGTQEVGRVSVQHAVKMLHRGVAKVFHAVEGQMFGPYPRPRAVELVRYVFTKWMYERTGRVMFSMEGVKARDCHRCGYCSRSATTVDHVVPRCQGGSSTWLNTVAACEDCNNRRKGGRTPKQAGMRLISYPFVPTLAQVYPR